MVERFAENPDADQQLQRRCDVLEHAEQGERNASRAVGKADQRQGSETATKDQQQVDAHAVMAKMQSSLAQLPKHPGYRGQQ